MKAKEYVRYFYILIFFTILIQVVNSFIPDNNINHLKQLEEIVLIFIYWFICSFFIYFKNRLNDNSDNRSNR